jgi:DnaJ-class molecular chaperone
MEKPKISKSKTAICPRCTGNGYFKVQESVEEPRDIIVQCPLCESEGEIDDPNNDIIIDSSGIHRLQ